MLPDGIRVDHNKLAQGSADVIAAARAIESRLDNLESELAPLKNDWTGSAKQAYADAKAKWDQAMTEMIALLEQAGRNVETSNDDYRAADARGASRF